MVWFGFMLLYTAVDVVVLRKAVPVYGKYLNYRGFQSSYKFGIEAGPNIKLPHPECLMIKELEKGALDKISGLVDYSFYDALREG